MFAQALNYCQKKRKGKVSKGFLFGKIEDLKYSFFGGEDNYAERFLLWTWI